MDGDDASGSGFVPSLTGNVIPSSAAALAFAFRGVRARGIAGCTR